MLKKIFLTLFFLSIPSLIYADYFHPYGDCSENRFFDTLGYGIESLASKGECANCLQFNSDDVKGSYTEYLLNSVNLDNLTFPDFSYGLVRSANFHSSVSLPPQSTVSFVYWYRNETGGRVNISSLSVFLSNAPLTLGDLRKVLDIDGEYERPAFNILTWNYKREGVLKRYNGLGLVNSNASGTIVLDSVTVKSPLLFERWEAQVEEGRALVRVYVKNISEYELPNIEYEHLGFFLKRDFLVGEEYMYEYVVDIDSEQSLGYASIYNPNVHRECAVMGEHMESYIVGNAAAVYGVREDGNSLNYVASRVKVYGLDFCVTRIAYTEYSGEMILKRESEEEIEQDSVVDDGSLLEEETPTVVEESFVLGVKSLPKTAKLSLVIFIPLLFVVVIVLVWYYLRRKV